MTELDGHRTYLAVQWKHAGDDYPSLLYHELDAFRCEIRKVEVFRDGRIHKADNIDRQDASTALSAEPVPSIEDLSQDPEFEACSITQDEFEEVWQRAVYT